MLESFLKLFQGARTDEVIWTADINYWIAGQKKAGTAKPEWDTEEGSIQLHKDLGIFPYYYYENFWLAEPQYSPEIQISNETEGLTSIRRIRTPVGELFEKSTHMPESCCSGCTKHMVESEEDLDVLLYILEHRTLISTNIKDFPQRMETFKAYDGYPAIGLPRSPLAALCCEWAGIENAAYLLMDCKDKVCFIFELMKEQEKPVLDAVCEAAPPLVHFPDNLSSDNLTSLYDDYMADFHRWRLDRLHAAGIAAVVHLDGTVKGLLPKLVEVGFDGVESLTPKPAGDLDVSEMNELAGNDRVILWGGVPGIMFAPPYTWKDMEAHVKRVLECWRDRPFVLGTADQVPPDGNIEFCRRIAEMLAQD